MITHPWPATQSDGLTRPWRSALRDFIWALLAVLAIALAVQLLALPVAQAHVQAPAPSHAEPRSGVSVERTAPAVVAQPAGAPWARDGVAVPRPASREA